MGSPTFVAPARCLLLPRALVLVGCTPPGLPPPQSPTEESSAPSTAPAASQVVIGVDGTVTGFNPHAIADFSPAARAVASLILPSTTVVHADGSTWFDPAIVTAAAVTSTDPYVVTYTVNQAAAWSDGTPVTAEDFTYLWEQMLVQPGTVDPAGYRLITAIRSRDAGKTVEVQFSGPFPAWPSLFSPLLPAHILKDAPGGWADGLDNGIPVSANRYKLSSYDTVTGQITLVDQRQVLGGHVRPGHRGAPDRVTGGVARRPAPGGSAGAVRPARRGRRLGHRPGGAGRAAHRGAAAGDHPAGAEHRQRADRHRRGASGDRHRPGLSGAAGKATGGRPDGMLPVSSQVQLPSTTHDDADTSAPPLAITGDADAARAVLADAGYRVDGLYARNDDGVLRLTLGVADRRTPDRSPRPGPIQTQLGRAGILVDLTLAPLGQLVTERVAQGQLDLALLTVPRSRSDSVAAASAFGCRSRQRAERPRCAPATCPATAEPTSNTISTRRWPVAGTSRRWTIAPGRTCRSSRSANPPRSSRSDPRWPG